MFTGLIEAIGTIKGNRPRGQGVTLAVSVDGLQDEPAPGASIAVDGVCLTVTRFADGIAEFDAVSETVSRSTLGRLRTGASVNLESALRLGDPLDGHLVQGHVDAVATLTDIRHLPESRVYRFTLPADLAGFVAEKGSVAISGVSLTVVEAGSDFFSVSLIPETLKRTTLGAMQNGAKINLEVDVLARYIARQHLFPTPQAGLTAEMLRQL